MPTVHTSDDLTPPILVVLSADAIEPDATVAPEGEVRFTVLNRTDRPREFLVVAGRELVGRWRVPADDSADVVIDLRSGPHVLATAAGDAMTLPFDAQADLTVQPADTYDVTETPPVRTEADPDGRERRDGSSEGR